VEIKKYCYFVTFTNPDLGQYWTMVIQVSRPVSDDAQLGQLQEQLSKNTGVKGYISCLSLTGILEETDEQE